MYECHKIKTKTYAFFITSSIFGWVFQLIIWNGPHYFRSSNAPLDKVHFSFNFVPVVHLSRLLLF
jgi:hypothetical protein